MTDHRTDDIRDLLARGMSDAPEPHAWVDVEQRARQLNAHHRARAARGLARCSSMHDRPRGRTRRASAPTTNRRCDRQPRQYHTTSTSAPADDNRRHGPDDDGSPAEAGWTGVCSTTSTSTRFARSSLSPRAMSSFRPHRLAGGSQTRQVDRPRRRFAPDFVEWSDRDHRGPTSRELLRPCSLLDSEPRADLSDNSRMQSSGESVTINGVEWESIVVERIPDDDPASSMRRP